LNKSMHFTEGIKQALHSVRSNRMRSLLLIIGVAIGVATLLSIYTIVQGLSEKIRSDIVSSNAPYLYVARYTGLGGEDIHKKLRRPQIMPECADAATTVEGANYVDYMFENNDGTILHYENERTNIVQIFGSSETLPWMYAFTMANGRYYTAGEVAARDRVCVLGDGPASTLFPNRDPIGKTLRLYGVAYEIIGTMESRRHVFGQMGDNFVAVPWTSFERDFSRGDNIDNRTMAVTVKDGYDSSQVSEELRGVLRIARKLKPGEPDDFDIVASETYGEMVDKLTGGVAIVLVVLSSIGLMVGGIGVMNIMLISVTERTKEIGLRMAVGARRSDVLRQILVESATLTAIGGAVGVVVGYGGAILGTKLLHFPFIFNPLIAVMAVMFSAGIGMFFGLYPANRAAKMDPVEALRME
jgi:putative ABC transport system permease protein